ncbi:MAG: amidophosphoribosyltransferase [Kiritimatiellae bacterium]|nr:amidophosphoribosyltransferase [Kiritimatiellia bacterium]
MSDELKHECAVAMVVLRGTTVAAGDYGGTKLSLLMEKQHNRGLDGAGAAILSNNPNPGEPPYWIAKSASATPLADILAAIGKRQVLSHGVTESQRVAENALCASVSPCEKIFLGHLRYATFGKNEVAFCHPFVHESSELAHTVLLAGNFNLTNARELFDDYRRHGSFPTSRSDGYLICELIAHELTQSHRDSEDGRLRASVPPCETPIARALSSALAKADGAWTLCGATGDGWAFATRDPCGIRPGFYYLDDSVVAVASERPAIQAAFDVPPEAVKELPPGQTLVVSPDGEVEFENFHPTTQQQRSCTFERIYFSRANDADIHRERKALGAALVPQILAAADAPIENIFFSYIPNSARIAFHGLLEELFANVFSHKEHKVHKDGEKDLCGLCDLCGKNLPRFGEVAVKDAKFRTFIADAAARREFYKHVYDVTYGLVRPGRDTLVVLDDSIVRGNTMKNAILPMLDRLGPKRIVVASSAPPIRYPDCYGIDMSTLGELVAFKALMNLLGKEAENLLTGLTRFSGLSGDTPQPPNPNPVNPVNPVKENPLAELYARFTEEEHCAEIARLLTPPGMKAEVKVVYQTVDNLRQCLQPPNRPATNHEPRTTNHEFGDWYFTGDYPTPGGYRVLHQAIKNYLDKINERSY